MSINTFDSMKWKPRIVSLISCVLGNDNDNGIEIRPKKYEMLNCLRLRLNRIINSKDVPREAEVAQGVPGRLKPRIFLTFWHYKGGRSSAKRTGRFYHRRNPWYSLSEAESTSGHMVLSGEPRKKFPVTPPEIDPGTVRLLAQCLSRYATPAPPPSG